MTTRTRKRTLPDAEVQALADLGLKAWERGLPEVKTDSFQGVWEFLAERTPEARLRLRRVTQAGTPHERVITAYATGRELGAHAHVRVKLASMVLAIASPP